MAGAPGRHSGSGRRSRVFGGVEVVASFGENPVASEGRTQQRTVRIAGNNQSRRQL